MKMLAALLVSTFLLAYVSNEPIPKHNVYFAWNTAEIKSASRQIIESIYTKTPAGKKVRFGIEGPVSSAHNTSDQNRIMSERASNILELLKQIGSEEDSLEIVDVTNPYTTRPSELTSSKPFVLEVVLTKAQGWVEPTFTSIDEFLPLPVQTFSINPREDNRLVGNQGTVINIPANTLALRNGSVPAQMTVELKEVYGAGQIVNANLHTASGGRMLETGGTIHLDANTNGSPAHIANGEAIDLEFPKGETDKEGMQVFNGRVDRSGNFDWVDNGLVVERVPIVREKFYINEKEVSKADYERSIREWEERKIAAEKRKKEQEEEAERQAKIWEKENKIREAMAGQDKEINAYLMSSTELGWINCDRFTEIEEKTDIIVMVDTNLRPSVRMVFTDIKSVMNGYYDANAGVVRFSGIPVGKTVQLVGYSIKDNVPYMANTKIKISSNLQKDLDLAQTTKKQMELELASLN